MEIEELLQPISEAEPTGTSLRYDPVYDQIREARRIEAVDASMGIWQPADIKGNDWFGVRKLCEDVIQKRSKDLQITYWRLEALTHLDGFAGLAEGLVLFASIMETFWPTLYPLIDEDGDLSFRLVPIRQMAQELPTLIYTLPITEPRGSETPILTHFEYLHAKKGEGNVSIDDVKRSFAETSQSWLKHTADGVSAVIENLKQVEDITYQHCGYDTPSFKDIYAILDDILSTFKTNVPDLFRTAEAETEGEFFAEEEIVSGDGRGTRTVQQDNSRVGAYRMLSQALIILEKAEPHSPVVIMLRHITDWESKGLHSIAQMLQSNDSSLADLLKTFPAEVSTE